MAMKYYHTIIMNGSSDTCPFINLGLSSVCERKKITETQKLSVLVAISFSCVARQVPPLLTCFQGQCDSWDEVMNLSKLLALWWFQIDHGRNQSVLGVFIVSSSPFLAVSAFLQSDTMVAATHPLWWMLSPCWHQRHHNSVSWGPF